MARSWREPRQRLGVVQRPEGTLRSGFPPDLWLVLLGGEKSEAQLSTACASEKPVLVRGVFRGVFSKSAQDTGPADWAAGAAPPHRHLEEEGAPQSVSGRTRSWPIPFSSDLLELSLGSQG